MPLTCWAQAGKWFVYRKSCQKEAKTFISLGRSEQIRPATKNKGGKTCNLVMHIPELLHFSAKGSMMGSPAGRISGVVASGLTTAVVFLSSADERGLSQPFRLLRRRPPLGVPHPPPSNIDTGLLLFPLGKLAKRSRIRRSSCSEGSASAETNSTSSSGTMG